MNLPENFDDMADCQQQEWQVEPLPELSAEESERVFEPPVRQSGDPNAEADNSKALVYAAALGKRLMTRISPFTYLQQRRFDSATIRYSAPLPPTRPRR